MSLLFALATLQVALSVPTNMLPIVVAIQGLDGVNYKLFQGFFLASLMAYIFSKCVIIWQPNKWIPILLTLISIGNNVFAIASIITHANGRYKVYSPGSLDALDFLSKIGANHTVADYFYTAFLYTNFAVTMVMTSLIVHQDVWNWMGKIVSDIDHLQPWSFYEQEWVSLPLTGSCTL
ncbi:hypothetical protein K435DRAFT_795028 [Dendrothele bispora CBS 962.96]|uniref:Uncharacterized protein n=1 Tax=Dendrothele bispora (strain CBS 962.96) TaxID=1314807 RepID=A0A4S8MA04_DENBC|nr:hypothetical protein K435DRAFT_795028 [Dendrothele bispora CBS 962.96]